MKWRLAGCVVLLACLIMQAFPVMTATANGTGVSGTVPLVNHEVSVSEIDRYSAKISWKTSSNATSQVFYDMEFHADITDYYHETDENTTLVAEHVVPISALIPGTVYHFRVKSVIPDTPFISISSDYAFTTNTDLPPPDEGVGGGGGGEGGGGGGGGGILFLNDLLDSSNQLITEGRVFGVGGECYLIIPKGTEITLEGKAAPYIFMYVLPETIEPPPVPDGMSIFANIYVVGLDGIQLKPMAYMYFRYNPKDLPAGVNPYIARWDVEGEQWVFYDTSPMVNDSGFEDQGACHQHDSQ